MFKTVSMTIKTNVSIMSFTYLNLIGCSDVCFLKYYCCIYEMTNWLLKLIQLISYSILKLFLSCVCQGTDFYFFK